MMKAISFKLSGKFAHFKKPDVNEYVYFTYNNIPKPTLLGLLGAIIGLKGYAQKTYNNKKDKKSLLNNENRSNEPEFYERLKHLKICIIPLVKYGKFFKKIQVFNNSVGYASTEEGGNLIVREQWLENPSWQILIEDDGSAEFETISQYLFDKKAKFIPYLGKNDHFADISEVEKIDLAESKKDKIMIKSLFLDNLAKQVDDPDDEISYLFNEFYPIGFNELMFYKLEKTTFTNQICQAMDGKWYEFKDGTICFF